MLVLIIGDMYVPYKAHEISRVFREHLQPGKIHQILCTGNVCTQSELNYLRTICNEIVVVRGELDDEGIASAEQVVLPIGGFKDFTKSLNPLIKYYSGTVTYRLEAVLPEDFLNGDRRIRISIPAFGSTASLEINGHRLETIWDPSFMADITEYVRKGANELKIVVTNPWRNRLTGDKAGIPSSQKLWTTSPLQQKHIPPQQIIHEYTKLYPAGISRPITIYAVEKTLL